MLEAALARGRRWRRCGCGARAWLMRDCNAQHQQQMAAAGRWPPPPCWRSACRSSPPPRWRSMRRSRCCFRRHCRARDMSSRLRSSAHARAHGLRRHRARRPPLRVWRRRRCVNARPRAVSTAHSISHACLGRVTAQHDKRDVRGSTSGREAASVHVAPRSEGCGGAADAWRGARASAGATARGQWREGVRRGATYACGKAGGGGRAGGRGTAGRVCARSVCMHDTRRCAAARRGTAERGGERGGVRRCARP